MANGKLELDDSLTLKQAAYELLDGVKSANEMIPTDAHGFVCGGSLHSIRLRNLHEALKRGTPMTLEDLVEQRATADNVTMQVALARLLLELARSTSLDVADASRTQSNILLR